MPWNCRHCAITSCRASSLQSRISISASSSTSPFTHPASCRRWMNPRSSNCCSVYPSRGRSSCIRSSCKLHRCGSNWGNASVWRTWTIARRQVARSQSCAHSSKYFPKPPSASISVTRARSIPRWFQRCSCCRSSATGWSSCISARSGRTASTCRWEQPRDRHLLGFVPADCPLIIESIIPAELIKHELDAVSALFDAVAPHAAIA